MDTSDASSGDVPLIMDEHSDSTHDTALAMLIRDQLKELAYKHGLKNPAFEVVVGHNLKVNVEPKDQVTLDWLMQLPKSEFAGLDETANEFKKKVLGEFPPEPQKAQTRKLNRAERRRSEQCLKRTKLISKRTNQVLPMIKRQAKQKK